MALNRRENLLQASILLFLVIYGCEALYGYHGKPGSAAYNNWLSMVAQENWSVLRRDGATPNHGGSGSTTGGSTFHPIPVGSASFPVFSKCATQEGEVQIVGPDNCRPGPGGDGTITFTWNSYHNQFNVCLNQVSLPHDVVFGRPNQGAQGAQWWDSSNSYDRHLQQIGYTQDGIDPVNTHATCLITVRDAATAIPVEMVYDKKTGQLMGSREAIGASYNPAIQVSIIINATVQIMDFPAFPATYPSNTNPFGRTTHCDNLKYNDIFDITTGNGGGWALFVPLQLCRPDEIGTYYSPWGITKAEAPITGDLVQYLISQYAGLGGGVGVAMNVEPGFNPLRTNVHSWILSVGGGLGNGFAGMSNACGNNFGFNMPCQGSMVMPPGYPMSPGFAFVYEPTVLCDPVLQTLDLNTCTCSPAA